MPVLSRVAPASAGGPAGVAARHPRPSGDGRPGTGHPRCHPGGPQPSPTSPRLFAHPGRRCSATLLSSGLGVQGMLWATSPACTELGTIRLVGGRPAGPAGPLPLGNGGGVIRTRRRGATLCAIIAAVARPPRRHLTGLVAYTSSQAPSSVRKGIRVAGLPAASLHTIDVDGPSRHTAPDALRAPPSRRTSPGPPAVLRLRHRRRRRRPRSTRSGDRRRVPARPVAASGAAMSGSAAVGARAAS